MGESVGREELVLVGRLCTWVEIVGSACAKIC